MKKLMILFLSAILLINNVSFHHVSAEGTHTVTYVYTGDVPEGVEQYLPPMQEYNVGDLVEVEKPTYVPNGYSFYGWDRNGYFIMPDQDIIITGKVKKINENTIYSYYTFGANLNLNRRNYTHTGHADDTEKAATMAAIQNENFRKALRNAIDKEAYAAAGTNPNVAIRNTVTPPKMNFIKDGSYYGELVQSKLQAYDGQPSNVSDGTNAYYSSEKALQYIEAAKNDGITFPISLDLPAFAGNENTMNWSYAIKQSVESATNGQILINVLVMSQDDYYNALYYIDEASQADYDISIATGWGPDYVSPLAFLGDFLGDYGIMQMGIDKDDTTLLQSLGYQTYLDLLEEAKNETDPDQIYEKCAIAEAYYLDKCFMIPITTYQNRNINTSTISTDNSVYVSVTELSSEEYTSADVIVTITSAEPISDTAKLALDISAAVKVYDEEGKEIENSGITVGSIRITLDLSSAFSPGDAVTITHYNDDGTIKRRYENLIVDKYGEVTITNTDGFSVFEVSSFEGYTNVVTRISGANRYLTSLQSADYLKGIMNAERFSAVVLTSGQNFADALAGSYLANRKDAPVLLINASKAAEVRNYIMNNLVPGGTVYVLGGDGAVKEEWVSDLKSSFDVKRLAGKDRYLTNLEILKESGFQGGDLLVCVGKSVNASGVDTAYADSLSASAVGLPILLVNKNGKLSDQQIEYLSSFGGKLRFFVIGGTGAVPESTVESLKAYGIFEKRFSGKNRYETSSLIAKEFFPNANRAVLAYGENFPDGLSGGPVAYHLQAPLLLSHSASNKRQFAASYAAGNGIHNGIVLGGSSLIDDASAAAIFSIDGSQILKFE